MLVHFKSNYVQISFLTQSVLQALHGYVIDYACKSNMNGWIDFPNTEKNVFIHY